VRKIKIISLVVLLFLSAFAMIALVRAWQAERTAPVTCNLLIQPTAPSPLRYIEIQLRQQHPIEPSFSGNLFALFQKDAGQQVQVWGAQNTVNLVVTHSAQGSYAPSIYVLPMEVREADWGGLVSTTAVDFVLETVSGAHRDFPFDSGVFDFTLKFQPPLPFGLVRITNRVPGFIAACSEGDAARNVDSSLHVRFTLHRSPLLQITALVLAVGFLIFLGFIVLPRTEERSFLNDGRETGE
jgi:hypothetical protein